MNIFADENIPQQIVTQLRAEGHQVEYVMQQVEDRIILWNTGMEEIYGWIGPVAAKSGWHCLIFEGPGQWAALKTNPGLIFRPDYENRLRQRGPH